MSGCESGSETSEELDVCSGSVNNKPGVTHFEILSKVHTWQLWLRRSKAIVRRVSTTPVEAAAKEWSARG
jgi:hypothetical protein